LQVENWLYQKHQVAGDENYRDPTNLQSKIQKHAAFEAELLANKNRIMCVNQEGEGLIEDGHFASEEIQDKLNNVDIDWRTLQETSTIKRDRLNDAYKVISFFSLKAQT
jgi:spectrin beta